VTRVGPGAVKCRGPEGGSGLDTDTRTAVCQELVSDPDVAADDIVVEVANGDVSLNGTVPSQTQSTEAVTAAQRVAGVTEVHDLLTVALPGSDYVDDAALARFANETLAMNRAVPAGVKAAARQGAIFLTGLVSKGAERAAAHDGVAGVAGVLSIANQTEVRGDT
jgi:hyperosmotically inducible periplasmic protein